MKKVVVFGNQRICIDCIKFLKERSDVEIACVIGSELERDKLYGYDSVEEYCRNIGIDFCNPKKLDTDLFERLKKIGPDIIFSIYYRNIFKEEYIDLPLEGIINLHPSLLPKYRGPAPTFWALINGEKITGLTIHYIDKGVDSGDVIAQVEVDIPDDITGYDLNRLIMEKGADLFKNVLPSVLDKSNKRHRQSLKGISYYGRVRQSVRNINWLDTTAEIYNKIRALTMPYEGAVAQIHDERIVVWSARKVKMSLLELSGPGKVINVDSKGITVSTVDGYLLIDSYDRENKNSSKTDFINVGDIFSV